MTHILAPLACNPVQARTFLDRLVTRYVPSRLDVLLLEKQREGMAPVLVALDEPVPRTLFLAEPFYGCTTPENFATLRAAREEARGARFVFPWGTFNANLFVLGSFLAPRVEGLHVHAADEEHAVIPLARHLDASDAAPALDRAEERTAFRDAVREARDLLVPHRDELVRASGGDLARSDTGFLGGFPAQIERAAMYARTVPLARGKRVLEVGAGAGWGARVLSHFAAHVRATDLDPAIVAFCGKVMARDNLVFSVADAVAPDLPAASCDVVLGIELIEHLDAPERFLAAARRLLVPGGALVLSTPDHRRFPWRALTAAARAGGAGGDGASDEELFAAGWCAPHVQAFTASSLCALVTAAGFEVEEVRHPAYGPGPGLVNLLARRDVEDDEAREALSRASSWDVFDFDFPAVPAPSFTSFGILLTARRPRD